VKSKSESPAPADAERRAQRDGSGGPVTEANSKPRGSFQDEKEDRDKRARLRLWNVRKLLIHRFPGIVFERAKIQQRYGSMTREELTSRLEVTFEEKVKLDLRFLDCVDRTRADVRAHYKAERLRRDRESKRRKRHNKPAVRPLSRRASALLCLIQSQRTPVPVVLKWAAGLRAFRNPRGRTLDRSALKRAVHRALDELVSRSAVQQELVVAHSGQRLRLVWRC
jgi:hypothetical protein